MSTDAKGYTLMELLISLTLVVVLTTLVVPGWAALLGEQRLAATTNTLVQALTAARFEAVKRGEGVVLCPSADGRTCAETPYHRGWLLRPAPKTVSALETQAPVLRAWAVPSGAVAIHTGTGLARYVAYRPDGQTRQLNGALQMGSFRLCHGERGRRVIISRTGRVRVERTPCGSQ
ncbi:GspH/FimT family pseudopilin [Ectothiorhodospira mobilis]|uniref:GspH/FimT family pseudopilin n=1 Tax=Ectothiorhodospira mobilis TaxID=195064 RepID=UPI001EE99B17|nr:GspH/FimT family pseudopilin [Ectothiorhodospira mobilis]MCG5536471.1 GspH/FimT family pseudopilin [Ectothiorhodospira mobilis]